MEFEIFEKRFLDYAETFADEKGCLTVPSQRKKEHTFDVCAVSDIVSRAEGFDENKVMIFRLCALFHDVSRFEQYRDYGTFRDGESFDHGLRSAQLIDEMDFLAPLAESVKQEVRTAVRVHNKIMIPADVAQEYLAASKMVRDADKLAIIKLVNDFFRHPEMGLADKTMKLDLPDTDGYEKSIVANILEGRPVAHREMKNVNDFKLSMFAWINDLNYNASALYVLQHKMYESLRELLPQSDTIDGLLDYTIKKLTLRTGREGGATEK